MEKGHGIGSGVSLFMCAFTCSDAMWRTFCPLVISNGAMAHIAGIFVAIPHILITRKGILKSLYEILFRREGLSNILGVTSTVSVFLVASYFNHWKIDLMLKHDSVRRDEGSRYPIKLLYTSR
jgi:preprotein translocase subunit SecY